MSLEGLKLAALYSYDCRKARMLQINKLLKKFILKGQNQEQVAEALKKLVSYDWYRLIAKNNGIEDVFAREVVEAYWIGNNLTKTISIDDKNLFLFHNFTVLTSPMTDVNSVDQCKISSGTVSDITKNQLMVSYYALVSYNGKFDLVLKSARIEKGFLGDVRVGDLVGFHVGIGRRPLSSDEASSLYEKTKQAIDKVNSGSQ